MQLLQPLCLLQVSVIICMLVCELSGCFPDHILFPQPMCLVRMSVIFTSMSVGLLSVLSFNVVLVGGFLWLSVVVG